MKQTTHLDKFANTGSPAMIFKIMLHFEGELRYVKYYEDFTLFNRAIAHYKGPGGYGGHVMQNLRMDFLEMVATDGMLDWQPACEPLIHTGRGSAAEEG